MVKKTLLSLTFPDGDNPDFVVGRLIGYIEETEGSSDKYFVVASSVRNKNIISVLDMVWTSIEDKINPGIKIKDYNKFRFNSDIDGPIGSSLSTGFQVYLSKCWDPYLSPGCTIRLAFFWVFLPCFCMLILSLSLLGLGSKSASLSPGFCVCRPRQYDTIC